MAAIFNRSFGRTTGYDYQISGLFNSCLFCPSPSGFAVNFNPLIFRSKFFCFPNCFPFPPAISPCFVPPLTFKQLWTAADIESLTVVSTSLRSALQLLFPHRVLPLFPALARPDSLIPFLSALVSCICHPFPCSPAVSHSQPYDMANIISSLLRIILFSRSHSVPRIQSVSLPPCTSPFIFVAQLSLLAHLLRALRAESPVRASVSLSATSGAQSPGKVSAGGPALAGKVSLAPGAAWASAWVKRRPVKGVVVEQGAAAVTPVVVVGAAAADVAAVAAEVACAVAGDAACAVAGAGAGACAETDAEAVAGKIAGAAVVDANVAADVVAGADADVAADIANAAVACVFGAVAADVSADVAGAVAGVAACTCAVADSGAGACVESEAEAVTADAVADADKVRAAAVSLSADVAGLVTGVVAGDGTCAVDGADADKVRAAAVAVSAVCTLRAAAPEWSPPDGGGCLCGSCCC